MPITQKRIAEPATCVTRKRNTYMTAELGVKEYLSGNFKAYRGLSGAAWQLPPG
jgi:hypothetical protein